MSPAPAHWRVHLLAFDAMELLDFAGPYEVFTTAARVHARMHPDAPPLWSVHAVAQQPGPVAARAGLGVMAALGFADAPAGDLVLIPGGVVDEAMQCQATHAWIRRQAAGARVTASVCTGAFLLAASGVIHDGPVTTHWEDCATLQQQFPALQVLPGKRWVDRGTVVTSAGISAGIDMSLHLVARTAGHALALRTARQMDYVWQHDHQA